MLFLAKVEGGGSLCKTAVGRPRRGMRAIDRLDRRGRDPAKVEGEPKERIGLILPAQACKAQASRSHTLTTRRG